MTEHIPVMPEEVLELLDVKEGGTYVDGTLGRGGHSRLILEKLGNGTLYAFDLDEEAIAKSRENLRDYENVCYIHDNFKDMDRYIDEADGILLDLGVSSPQFDEGDRGFSYRSDAPLDMRMDRSEGKTARDIVNTYSESELARILWEYGEERFSRQIARKIVERRKEKEIDTTGELVEIIREALPQKQLKKKGHPAKQTFQALRIEVNGELDSLRTFLDKLDSMLKPGGTCVIITFHSLEDRMVKQAFKKLCTVEDDKRIAKRPEEVDQPNYESLNRKGIRALPEEQERNRRARSAIVRGVRKLWQRS
ncbi:MAG: 16S rRNA (cytosine(1402)-N(4))-methyltransferase RsmH [Erysipelotrichaceae bacterium]|nr:16S rRNA (cytosine(1402)-N(4))-methyltransferase RsmH [Erysipelotrichaceae bacterium]